MSSDAKLTRVVQAVRAGDDAALAAALAGLGNGYLWGSLELRAHEASKAGDPDLAFRLYVVIVNGQRPSLGAWNNLCWTLNAAKNRPDVAIARPLLERALAVGPMNPSIFHNVACAAVKYGLDDLAFDAIAGAAKYGYGKLDRVRGDVELAALAKDPRFEEALRATVRWSPEELDKLALVLSQNGERHVVHRAIMQMTFYFAGSLAEILPRTAPLLDAYLADIPPGTLKFYQRGAFKPLTKTMLTKTRNELMKPAASRVFLRVCLRPTDGDACEFEFRAEGDDDDGTVTVSVAFPLAEAHDPDVFEARFVRYATLTGADAGHAGYSVSNRQSDAYEGLHWNRADLAERFVAFQSPSPWWAPRRAPPAHWLVWLGGKTKLEGAVFGEARATTSEAGRAIRAARVPPITASDAGAIPDVARALAPLRIEARGEANVAYLARWDEMKSTPWENAPAGWTPVPARPKAAGNGAPTPKKKSAKKRSFFDA